MPRAGLCSAVALFHVLILCLNLPLSTASNTCYFPGRATASGYTPCGNATDGVRSCCGRGEPCLSNGLCFSPVVGVVYRGACTDESWSSSACVNIFTAQHENSTANMYHCYGAPTFQVDNNSCSDPDVYQYNSASIIPYQGAPTPITASTATPSSASATAAAVSSSPTADSQNLGSGDSGKTVGLGVGLGMGIPLLALAATFCFLWLAERRKRVEAERKMAGWNGPAVAPAPFYPPPLQEMEDTTKIARELDAAQ